jgi:hypothetical protein
MSTRRMMLRGHLQTTHPYVFVAVYTAATDQCPLSSHGSVRKYMGGAGTVGEVQGQSARSPSGRVRVPIHLPLQTTTDCLEPLSVCK